MSSVAALWSPLLFALALFLSSALLFLVQPMVGRTLLPHLGGNPLAWNACLVFFQATLLAGYVYADLLHRFRGLRWQPWVQLLLLGTATTLCFTGLFGDHPLGAYAARLTALDTAPIFSTLCLLTVVIGLPVLALAAVGPLVQRWFAHLDHPRASDPYFLFVASNLGGLTALIIYALVIEPQAPLYAQWMSWKLALTALGVLLFLVALCAWLSPRNPELEPKETPTDPNAPLVPRLIGRGPATWPRRWYWFAASSIPVALMMGVTDYLTLDVAPAPILWTLPLALYLLAFSQAFGRFSPLERGGFTYKLVLQIVFGLFLALALAVMMAAVLSEQNRGPGGATAPAALVCACFLLILLVPQAWLAVLQPVAVVVVVFTQVNVFPIQGLGVGVVLLHGTAFYLSARLCLGMLAADRPAAPALTSYYNWIGIGGLCGGLFQLVIAPILFRRAYLEYPLLLALASTLRPAWFPNGLSDWLVCMVLFKSRAAKEPPSRAPRRVGLAFDFAFPFLLAFVVAGLFLGVRSQVQAPRFNAGDVYRLLADFPLVLAVFGATVLYLRPLRFGLAMAAIVALSFIGIEGQNGAAPLVLERTCFGIIKVTENKTMVNLEPGDLRNPPPPRQITERTLMHGSTHHGACVIDPPELKRYPTTYYHELGPVGRVMHTTAWFTPSDVNLNPRTDWYKHHRAHDGNDARIAASLVGMGANPLGAIPAGQLVAAWSEPPYAIVGLGAGGLFAYTHPYQWVDAYELDPAVADLSLQSPPVFHYALEAQKRGAQGQLFIGDARRNLSKPDREFFYQMIFVDAFNSDAIPIHLLTEEAIVTYFRNLAPDGIICIHTSNRYVDLPKVLDRIAKRLDVPMRVLRSSADRDETPLFFSSEWVVLARDNRTMDRWSRVGDFDRMHDKNKNVFVDPFNPRGANLPPWTDEHASLMDALRPGQGWPALISALLVAILLFGFVFGIVELAAAMLGQKPVRRQK